MDMGHGGDIYRNKVKLDFSVNLNPAGTPEEMQEALRESLKRADVYPDPEQQLVRESLGALEGVPAEQVFAGNGASGILLAAVLSISPARTLLFDPCFTGYAHVLEAAGTQILRAGSDEGEDYAWKPERSLDKLQAGDLVILCDPVNPTGRNLDEEILNRFLEEAEQRGIYVLLDESFLLLSEKGRWSGRDRTAALLRTAERRVIVRSFTKLFSIPGIRAGYVLSSSANIGRIRAFLPEWDLSVPAGTALIAGCRILTETDFAERSIERIRGERLWLAKELARMGFRVFSSDANYLLFKGSEGLYERMLDRGVLIRSCVDYPGLDNNTFRIAVKRHEENVLLIQTLAGLTGSIRSGGDRQDNENGSAEG